MGDVVVAERKRESEDEDLGCVQNLVAEFRMADRILSKSEMSTRARVFQCLEKGNSVSHLTREQAKAKAHDFIDEGKLIDAIALLKLMWYQDWKHHLNRDFIVEGDDPEHCVPWGV